MRRPSRLFTPHRLGWYLAAMIILLGPIQAWLQLRQATGPLSLFDWTNTLGLRIIIPATFSILAALILQRQPDNRVGWLMMVVALGTVNPSDLLIKQFYPAPVAFTLGLRLLVWLDGWSWIPFIFPIFLIPLHFPSGHPPSPRWNWVSYLALGMWLFFILFIPFLDELGPLSGDWVLPNPVGFLPLAAWSGLMETTWTVGLLTVVIASVISLVVRYRRSQSRERQQIKWLLYAGAVFAIFYTLTAIFANLDDSDASIWFNLGLFLSVLAIPAAIAIAILRHRLYDIDLLIRRTLLYSLVTGVLALVFFGGVTIFQAIFTRLTGQESSLAIALSTLAIAALFNPLRKRVQSFIDRRFYRKKYDAQQILESFTASARNEVELSRLSAELVRAASETLKPDKVSLWINKT